VDTPRRRRSFTSTHSEEEELHNYVDTPVLVIRRTVQYISDNWWPYLIDITARITSHAQYTIQTDRHVEIETHRHVEIPSSVQQSVSGIV